MSSMGESSRGWSGVVVAGQSGVVESRGVLVGCVMAVRLSRVPVR